MKFTEQKRLTLERLRDSFLVELLRDYQEMSYLCGEWNSRKGPDCYEDRKVALEVAEDRLVRYIKQNWVVKAKSTRRSKKK